MSGEKWPELYFPRPEYPPKTYENDFLELYKGVIEHGEITTIELSEADIEALKAHNRNGQIR